MLLGSSRRDFLKIGAAGLLGLGAASAAPDAKRPVIRGRNVPSHPSCDSVILLWMGGGPSTIDMWDLKPDAPAGIRGEFKPIASALPGLRVCELMPRLAKTVAKATLVRSVQHSLPEHGTGSAWMTTGNSPIGSLAYPALGALAAKLRPSPADLPSYVAAGGKGAAQYAGYLGAGFNPFVVDSLPGGKTGRVDPAAKPQMRGVVLPGGFPLSRLEDRRKLLEGFDRGLAEAEGTALVEGLDGFRTKALDILRSPRTRQALDLGKEAQPVRERYGMTPFGQGALIARRLAESGVRFVTLGLSAWDTHQNNFPQLRTLLPQFDQTVSALIEDLDARGMLARTAVYVAGEFGRTPKINPEGGRDHWAKAQSVLLAGGGFKRGHVHGATDKEGMAASLDPCSPDDVAATLMSRLGIAPGEELTTDTGRPVQLFREGKVMRGLLA
ncbi:MAG: DUF1501 domain-containing protein [Gemmataceae bacterium]|nr:DUF1501 domain-containing protein [Gemmataceae bacterium]